MVHSEKSLYLYETEIKPNTYSYYVFIVTILTFGLCLILNELGVFKVGSTEMRIGIAVPVIFALVPVSMISKNKKYLTTPYTKYLFILCAFVTTLSIHTLMTFHTSLFLLFPLLLAMLYRSIKLGRVAAAASVICTITGPILGYVIGAWDIDLFRELINIGTGTLPDVNFTGVPVSWLNIGKILLYIVLPRLLMISITVLLTFYVIRLGVDHVENQIKLSTLSHKDSLTGLYNRNYFKEITNNGELKGDIGVIFFDVNGLKTANDSKGHEYGDLLLKCCADSLSSLCNDDTICAFRIGGDEFIVLVADADETTIELLLSEWERNIAEINRDNKKKFNDLVCSMAVGYAVGDCDDLPNLIKSADKKMYDNKLRMKEERNQ